MLLIKAVKELKDESSKAQIRTKISSYMNRAEELKTIMRPLFEKHMDAIISGDFSKTMMTDWSNDDVNLLQWRAETGETAFEKTKLTSAHISEQEYFEHGVLLVAFVKSGVELAFETMVSAGIFEDSAYYESLHELPLIANTIKIKACAKLLHKDCSR